MMRLFYLLPPLAIWRLFVIARERARAKVQYTIIQNGMEYTWQKNKT